MSRAIKELEEDLGVVLFARTTRSTRLTHAGALFLEHARRVLTALEQARGSVKAAANGFHGQLRVAMLGNLGDTKPVGDGVIEMREHFGLGWRMYFVLCGEMLIVMLGGGDKSTQAADIAKAQELANLLED